MPPISTMLPTTRHEMPLYEPENAFGCNLCRNSGFADSRLVRCPKEDQVACRAARQSLPGDRMSPAKGAAVAGAMLQPACRKSPLPA